MQQWEIKNHWVPIDVELHRNDSSGEYLDITLMPLRKEHFQKAWAEAELLANDGWELVSVAPSQSGFMNVSSHLPWSSSYGSCGGSYTSGHLLVFKRPKP